MSKLLFGVLFLTSVISYGENEMKYSVSVKPETLTPAHTSWPSNQKPQHDVLDPLSSDSQVLSEQHLEPIGVLVDVFNPSKGNMGINVGIVKNGKKESFCSSQAPLGVFKVEFYCSAYFLKPGRARLFVDIVPFESVSEDPSKGQPLFSCRNNVKKGCAGDFTLQVQ